MSRQASRLTRAVAHIRGQGRFHEANLALGLQQVAP